MDLALCLRCSSDMTGVCWAVCSSCIWSQPHYWYEELRVTNCCVTALQMTVAYQQIFIFADVSLPELELSLQALDSLLSTELHNTIHLRFRQLLASAEIFDGVIEQCNILGGTLVLLV